MKALIACEESQEVTKAFRALGHEAYSCDVLPCSGGHPEWHLEQDVIEANISYVGKKYPWDMIIAFPPCTDLAVSGARWFKEKIKDGRQLKAITFFRWFTELNCPKIAIENPIGIMSKLYRKPDQIIHPYMFWDAERKATCLWLKGLPLLIPNNIVEPSFMETKTGKKYTNIHNGMGFGWNTPECKRARSKTFTGIALAMADQWGNLSQTSLF
jgi:hypothetical protein